jgi:hypothetical protein
MKRSAGNRRIDLPNGMNVDLPVYEDPNLTRLLSYSIRGYTTLSALGKSKHFPANVRLQIYETHLPNFRQDSKLYSAVLLNDGREDYTILVDERLTESEKLGAISHELGHLSGGHKTNENETQNIAINHLKTLYTGYDTLSDPATVGTIKREARVNFDASEIPKETLAGALKYVVGSAKSFGINDSDLASRHAIHRTPTLADRLPSLILISSGLFLLLKNIVPTGAVIGISSMNGFFDFVGIFSFIVGLLLFVTARDLRNARQGVPAGEYCLGIGMVYREKGIEYVLCAREGEEVSKVRGNKKKEHLPYHLHIFQMRDGKKRGAFKVKTENFEEWFGQKMPDGLLRYLKENKEEVQRKTKEVYHSLETLDYTTPEP